MTPLEYENNLYTEMYAFLKTESDNILDDAHSKTFSFLFQKIAQLQHEINELKKSSAIINSIPSARVYGPVKNNRWKIIWKDLTE